MKMIYLTRASVVIFVNLFLTFGAIAQNTNSNSSLYPVIDVLEIQTIVYQTELYREYKLLIEDAIFQEEQEIQEKSHNWNVHQWHKFVDNLIETQAILKIPKHEDSKNKISMMKKVRTNLNKAIKSVISSIISMGRKDGTASIIAYLGGSAAGYAMVGVGIMINNAAMVSFFSVFPVATITVSAAVAVKNIANRIQSKKAFSQYSDENFDYYKEFKDINQKVKTDLNLKKGNLIYVLNEQGGVLIRKKGLISRLVTFLGFNRKKLSLLNLVRALKKSDLYSTQLKAIKKSKTLGRMEKIIFMLHHIEKNFDEKSKNELFSQFSSDRVYKLPDVQRMQEISVWGIDVSKIEDLQDLPSALSKAPIGVSFMSIMKVYQDFIVPRLADSLGGVAFDEFKCLRRAFFEQIAVGYKNVRLLWRQNSVPVNDFLQGVESCVLK